MEEAPMFRLSLASLPTLRADRPLAASRSPRHPKPWRWRRRPGFRPWLEALEDRLAPATFNVTTNLEPSGTVNLTTGVDTGTGKVTLRGAIEAANHLGGNNTINVPAGTYHLSQGQVSITNDLTLTGAVLKGTALGGNLAPTSIINAGPNSRIFQVSAGFAVAISNVTLENGAVLGTASSPGQGGGIFDSGSLTLTNDILQSNLVGGAAGAAGAPGKNGANATFGVPATAGGPGGNGQAGGNAEGGAIYVANAPEAALTITNSVLANNAAIPGIGGNGGPGGNAGTGFAFNSSRGLSHGAPGGSGGNGGSGGTALGGGLYVAGGIVSIQNSVFSGNAAVPFIFSPQNGGRGGNGGAGGGQVSQGGVGGIGGFGGPGGGTEGGAIFNRGNTTILDSSFSGNLAIGGSGGPGGSGGVGSSGNTGGPGGAGLDGGDGGYAEAGAIANANGATMKIDSSSLFNNQAIAGIGGNGGNGGNGGSGSLGNHGGNGGNGGNGNNALGGCFVNSGSLTLTHSSVALNTAVPGLAGAAGSGGPGGISQFGGQPNGAPGSAGLPGAAGGAAYGGIEDGSGLATVYDTIIAANTAPSSPDVGLPFTSLGHNLIGNGSGGSGFTKAGDQVGTSTNPINPQLNIVGNFLVPQQTSPALQAGDSTKAPTTDERGLPRVVDDDANLDSDGAKIDIGAVEFQATDPSVTISGSPISASPTGTITYTITVKTGTGDNNVSNLTLTDQVPGQTTFESFTAPAGWVVTQPGVGGTGTVKATILSLAPSSTASFTLKVKVNAKPTVSSTTDTATITTTSPDPTTTDNSTSVTTSISVGWLAVANDAGDQPEVKVYNPQTGQLRFDFLAFDPSFTGGVRLAVGDVSGDGIADILAAQGPSDGASGDSLVHVYSGITGQLLAGPLGSIDPFPGFHGGLYVAAADLNGSGHADIIVTQDAGGQGLVNIYSGQTGALLEQFQPYGPSFTGAVRLAAGPVVTTSSGHIDVGVVTGAGPGGPPLVEVFDGPTLLQGVTTPVASFDAFDPSFSGGVYVATGLIHNQGKPPAAIVVGAGAGGEPRVSVFDGTGTQVQTFLAFDRGFKGGVRVAAADVDADGRSDIVVAEGPGPGSKPKVRGFNGLTLQRIDRFFAFPANDRAGLFVAGGGKWGVLPAPSESDDDLSSEHPAATPGAGAGATGSGHSEISLRNADSEAGLIVLPPDLASALVNSPTAPPAQGVDAVFVGGLEPWSVRAADFLLAAFGRKLKEKNQTILA
jgi:uncharacterized repeat protein (TIGR01451 family)